jgi:hypothetical protein
VRQAIGMCVAGTQIRAPMGRSSSHGAAPPAKRQSSPRAVLTMLVYLLPHLTGSDTPSTGGLPPPTGRGCSGLSAVTRLQISPARPPQAVHRRGEHLTTQTATTPRLHVLPVCPWWVVSWSITGKPFHCIPVYSIIR